MGELIQNLLENHAVLIGLKDDPAAETKAAKFQKVAHGRVVFVGIDAQGTESLSTNFFLKRVEHRFVESLAITFPLNRAAMHDHIGKVAEPLAFDNRGFNRSFLAKELVILYACPPRNPHKTAYL